jgi:hypothetical protein
MPYNSLENLKLYWRICLESFLKVSRHLKLYIKEFHTTLILAFSHYKVYNPKTWSSFGFIFKKIDYYPKQQIYARFKKNIANCLQFKTKKISQIVCSLKQSLYICPRKQTNDNENNFRKCMLVALLTTSKVVRKQYSCIYTKIKIKDIYRGLSHCDRPLFFTLKLKN